MSKIVSILKLFLMLAPIVREAVMTAEAMLPVSGAGKEKLAIVKQMVESAFELAGQAEVTFNEVWPKIDGLITLMVATFKTFGQIQRPS